MTDRRSASLSLKQLAYLLAVRDTLNFTRAAEQCFVTQSSLSGGLAELERNLGLKLVERSRQHVAMTAVGEAVCARAEQILSASEDLLAFARAQAEPGTGSLRLGIIPTIAPYLLHDFLAGTAEHFPTLELFLHERQTDNLLAEVSGGELDAAVLALPMDTGSLEVTHLFDDPLRLLAAPGHPVAGLKAPLTIYRALDKLMDQGLVHRIESLNAFVHCDHGPHDHATGFLICSDCGRTLEVHLDDCEDHLAGRAREQGFAVDAVKVEMTGRCPDCAAAHQAASSPS